MSTKYAIIVPDGAADEPLEELKSIGFVMADADVKKININQADFSTLVKHPYTTKKMANAILAYR